MLSFVRRSLPRAASTVIAAIMGGVLSASATQGGGFVDPFLATPWAPAGSQSQGLYGFSVATGGDVDGDGFGDVLVGAPYEDGAFANQGAAYLYRGSAEGTALTHAWTYSAPQAEAYTAYPVAPAGDVNGDGYSDVLVAIPLWDTPQNADVGKVSVFHGGPGGLPPAPNYDLFSSMPSDNHQFGIAAAPAGDVNGDGFGDVIVGARAFDGGFQRGAAFVFHGSASGLSPSPARVWQGEAGVNSRLGSSLSSAGDVNADGFADLIVGAPGEATPFGGGGNAYLYLGSAAGAPADPDTVIRGLQIDARCGHAVSLAGDVNGDGYGDVLIGVPGLNSNTGQALLGLGGAQGLASVTPLTNPEQTPNEHIGHVLSTLGDLDGDGFADFGIGARYASVTNRGRISVFRGTRGGVEYVGDILTRGDDGFFGACLGPSDADGDGLAEILVGTEDMSLEPGQQEGRAFQFRAPRNLVRIASGGWPRAGAQAGTRYGAAVAIVPRMDGADAAKLVIGDPQFDGVGRISVHGGSTINGVNFNESRSVVAPSNFHSLGARLVDAGDMDGDGYCDFAVSSTTRDNGPAQQAGQVDLHRGALGAPPAPSFVVAGASDFDRMGSALAGRGDVNGDGFHDLLVGAREWDEPGLPDCGKVLLFFGSASGPVLASPWTRLGSVSGQGLGAGVALGDLDGDGYTDVIVGSSSPTFAATASGRVEVYYGGPTGPAITPGLVYTAPNPQVTFGLVVASIGDVNADGVADLGVGAPLENNRGVVRIYAGTLGRSQSPIPIVTIAGTQDGGRFGEAMAGGGDVDGDGRGDFVIGEPGWDGGQTDEGRFGLHFGAPFVPEVLAALHVESNIVGAELGASFSPLRDLNLDGFADVVVGAPGAAGRVYPFLGGNGPGRRLELQTVDWGGNNQRRVHPGLSHQPDQIAGQLYFHTAAGGRARIRFQHEIRTHNEPFIGVPTSTGPFGSFDSGPAGSESFVFASPAVDPPLPGRAVHVRARWTTPSPFFPRSRWVTPEAHTSGDHDLRLAGEAVGVPPVVLPGPGRLRIDAVMPNPAVGGGSASHIALTLPAAGRVAVDVHDLRGARVRRVLDEARPAGPSAAAWDGRDDAGRAVAAGVYFVILRVGGTEARAKVVRMP